MPKHVRKFFGICLQIRAERGEESLLRHDQGPQQRAPVVELVAVGAVAALAGDGVVVLVDVAVLLPFRQKKRGGLLRKVCALPRKD